MYDTDVIVIGAGAAGLAAGRRIAAARLAVTVLEARGRTGGRAWTLRETTGLPLDLGCGWLHSADKNDWAAIAERLGFAIDRMPAPWGTGERTLFFPDRREFAAAAERFFARLAAAADSAVDRPASDFLEPGSRWNPLLNALSTYISGAELDQVSVRDLGNYSDTGQNWRVIDGYGTLVEAYGAPLDVRLDCPVRLVDHSGAQVRVETPHGALRARAAIVAVPSSLIARELPRFVPALPDKVEAAGALPLGLDDKLFLRVDRPDDFPLEHRLFGATDQPGTGTYHLRPLGRPIIECYFGGRLARDLEAEGDAGFTQYALDQLAAHFGADIRTRLHPIAGSAWGRDPYALGAYSYARPGQFAARGVLAAPVNGRLFFAGEASSVHDYSTAHGAYRTGVRAADEAIRALASPALSGA
jgi:monoamine oxidase